MPRRAALARLAVLAPFIAAAPASAETLVVSGLKAQRELACDGQDVAIMGHGHRVSLGGRCGEVQVAGEGHTVTLADARRLEVMGTGHSVTASGTVETVAVYGLEQRVTAATAPGQPATAELMGASSLLRMTLNGPLQAQVAGTENRLLWTKAAPGIPDPVGDVGGFNSVMQRDTAAR